MSADRSTEELLRTRVVGPSDQEAGPFSLIQRAHFTGRCGARRAHDRGERVAERGPAVNDRRTWPG